MAGNGSVQYIDALCMIIVISQITGFFDITIEIEVDR